MDIHEKFKLLEVEIQSVSKLAKDYFESDDFSNESKHDGSVVTAIDTEVESRLRAFVDTHFPDDAIVGEEQENKAGTSGFVWHIDPIDGTDNFLRKIPFCAVSIARLGDTLEGSFAIVHNPITNHTFASVTDNDVTENERITKCTAEPLGGEYVIGLGRGRDESWMKPAAYGIIEAVGSKYGRCMPYHCSALELAYISAGRIDGYLTFGLHSYDYAAGLYLARSAGASISVFENGIWRYAEESIKAICDTHGKTLFVSHPQIHKEIRDFISDPRQWADTEK